MNIVIVHDDGVSVFKTWREMSRFYAFSKDEFAQVGQDYILNTTKDSFEVAKDIRLLETVASQRVFAKDKFDITNWLQFGVILVSLMIWTGQNSIPLQVAEQVKAQQSEVDRAIAEYQKKQEADKAATDKEYKTYEQMKKEAEELQK